MKSIVIRIVTYNQEDVVGRAIDSVLRQKDWGLYRVVVSDDCSTDGTWEVLQKYHAQYPDLVYIYRNEHNLGMYENFQKSDTYIPDCDLFSGLAGDDEYCDGYFEALQKFIVDNNIDTAEPVGIFSDWMSKSPDGVETHYSNRLIETEYSAWQLKIRSKITCRSLFVSKIVKNRAKPTILNKGLRVAEANYDVQPVLNIEKSYYMPRTTSIYYTDIGVSRKLNLKNSDYLTTQNIEKWKSFIELYIRDERDLNYANYEITKSQYLLEPSWKKLLKLVKFYNRGQLPKCKEPISRIIRLFLALVKYKILFKK